MIYMSHVENNREKRGSLYISVDVMAGYEQAPLEYVLGTPFRTGTADSFPALNTLPLSAILPRATNDPS